MSVLEQPCAIVHAWQCDASANTIKRLALLFERVYYIPPTLAIFRGGVSELESRRREVSSGGPCWIEGFSWWEDIRSALAVDVRRSPHRAIAEVVETLEQIGALAPAIMAPHAKIPIISDDAYSEARIAWMKYELEDPAFLGVTGTRTDWQSQPLNMGTMELRSDAGKTEQVVWVNPPSAWSTSESLTEISFLAEQLDAVPVLVAPAHVHGLSRRFAQIDEMTRAADVGTQLTDDRPTSTLDRTALGRCLFVLAGKLFDDETIESLPTSEVVRLRIKMQTARRELLDECLRSIYTLTKEDMSLDKLELRVQEHVRNDLYPALKEFREEARRAKEDLMGNVAVRATEAGSRFLMGGAAGGLVATVFSSSLWSLFLAGACAAAVRTLPALAEDLKESYIQSRRQHRNGLALIDAVQHAAANR